MMPDSRTEHCCCGATPPHPTLPLPRTCSSRRPPLPTKNLKMCTREPVEPASMTIAQRAEPALLPPPAPAPASSNWLREKGCTLEKSWTGYGADRGMTSSTTAISSTGMATMAATPRYLGGQGKGVRPIEHAFGWRRVGRRQPIGPGGSAARPRTCSTPPCGRPCRSERAPWPPSCRRCSLRCCWRCRAGCPPR